MAQQRRKPDQTIAELERTMTPKQVKLARALAAGGIPKVEAYRQVYGWKGTSKNALQVRASEAAGNSKVSVLATALREGETARLWEDKGKFRNWIMQGITDTASNAQSDITRLKALELAGRTRYASLYEEPQANEANTALSGAMVDTLQAKLLCLLGVTAPMLGDDGSSVQTLDTEFNPVPPNDTTSTPTPTGGGEGE
jgi:hypothetical protein